MQLVALLMKLGSYCMHQKSALIGQFDKKQHGTYDMKRVYGP